MNLDQEDTHNVTEPSLQILLDSLEETPSSLAKKLERLGDSRAFPTILRSIQRMNSGESRLSGEMLVIANLLLQKKRRRDRWQKTTEWRTEEGDKVAQISEFKVTLEPQTRGRWRVNVRHVDGYSHPWPAWQDNLEAAKKVAYLWVQEAEDALDEYIASS